MTNPEKRFLPAGFSLPVKRGKGSFFCGRGDGMSGGESGFVLVLAVIILLVLSLLGIWALRTSNFELDVSGSSQQVGIQQNLAEGASYNEAVSLGYNIKAFYQISDPTVFNQVLWPVATTDFNPGSYNNIKWTAFNAVTTQTDPTQWPYDNLLRNYTSNNTASNQVTYRYLTTYLTSGPPPMGYSANNFSGYTFRIQGAPVTAPLVVEVGGNKVGVKQNL